MVLSVLGWGQTLPTHTAPLAEAVVAVLQLTAQLLGEIIESSP